MNVSKTTRRTLNPLAALVLLLGGSALVAGVRYMHGIQVKRSAPTLLTLADQAEEEGKSLAAADVRKFPNEC